MGRIQVVDWDVDKVWYKDISTSYCANTSPLDPKSYLQQFLSEGWFTDEDVRRWAEYRGRDATTPIQTPGDLAECLTDFLYRIKKPDGSGSVITKEQTIQGKQALLRGLTMKNIREIADSIELTPGLRDAITTFRGRAIYQVAFSDGLGPFIAYMAKKEGMNYWGVVPAIVEVEGVETAFRDTMITFDDVKLTGKVDKFNKSEAFFSHMGAHNYSLNSIAAIDDSGTNVPALKKIIENGGIAIGFNPTETHEKDFREAGIPMLKQSDRSLEPFREIVLNPTENTIGKYCI